MSSIVTRDQMKLYNSLKNKIITLDKSTQTMPSKKPKNIIIITNNKRKKQNKDDSDDDYYEDEESEYESEYDNDETSEDNDDIEPAKKKLKRFYIDTDIEYYKALDEQTKEAIDNIERQINLQNNTSRPLRFKILESDMDIKLKALAISKVDQLTMLDPCSSESYKLTNWIENLARIPIGKYQSLPVTSTSSIEDISDFLDKTKSQLDDVVYGHKEAKDQIIKLLAKWISNPQSKGLVIGIQGVHGIGKTSLVKDGISRVLGLPFGFIPLGGISDGSYMVGHSYTYEGSRWGKIADVLMKAGCMNPILYFDELDKISTTMHGEEVSNLLIHLTDSTQNDKFHDKYFTDLDFDLSRSLMIFSYNHIENVNPILRDRMIVIKASGYDNKDKIKIAQDYMVPQFKTEYNLQGDIIFPDDTITHIIKSIEDEKGVRNLKRALDDIISQVNLHYLLKKSLEVKKEHISIEFPFTITPQIVDIMIKKKEDTNTSLPMMYI